MSKDKMTFEESMSRLETIVSELEKGDGSLEESLAKFEEGIRLGQSCKKIIDDAEARVKRLVDEDEIREEEFDGDTAE